MSEFWLRVQKFITIFILRKIQLLILRFEVKHVYGPEKIDYDSNELIVFSVVKDGELYLKSFIDHYFSLGVKHIVFLNNHSTDHTISIAKKYENITILQTNLPFKIYALAMRHYLMIHFGRNGRWILNVDIDEFFDYPFSNDIPLKSFLGYLRERSYTAVVAHLLDMFSDKSLSQVTSTQDDLLKDLYRYYDLSDLVKVKYYFPRNVISNEEITIYHGGIRKTLFGPDGNDELFLLIKHPLVFLDGKVKPMFLHEHDIRYAHLADISTVLYHYRFLGNFYERTLRNIQQNLFEEDCMTQNKRYFTVLEQDRNLQLKQPTSRKMDNVNELVDNQFLVVSEKYMNWVKEHRLQRVKS